MVPSGTVNNLLAKPRAFSSAESASETSVIQQLAFRMSYTLQSSTLNPFGHNVIYGLRYPHRLDRAVPGISRA